MSKHVSQNIAKNFVCLQDLINYQKKQNLAKSMPHNLDENTINKEVPKLEFISFKQTKIDLDNKGSINNNSIDYLRYGAPNQPEIFQQKSKEPSNNTR